jgi:hypothetical protein
MSRSSCCRSCAQALRDLRHAVGGSATGAGLMLAELRALAIASRRSGFEDGPESSVGWIDNSSLEVSRPSCCGGAVTLVRTESAGLDTEVWRNAIAGGLCQPSTSLASDPSSQMSFPGSYPWLLEQCAAAAPNAKMKHLGVLPARNHDGDHREQHGNHDEDKKCSLGVVPCITEPCRLIDQRLRVGRRADRLLDLGSLAPGDPPARLAPNKRGPIESRSPM